MLSQRKDEVTPWDPYCDHPIDLILVVDGSGSTTKAENKQRWLEMIQFCKALVKGFDDHTHIGVIRYGSEPEVVADMNKNNTRKDINELLSGMVLPGGGRTLNDALKRSWKDQFKASDRDVEKVIVAMSTGDIQYGLFGSSQFLTDHDVRVVAVGVDKNVHYDFLESVASNRSPGNIFSLNGGQLVDAAPFVYRDICNTAKASSREAAVSAKPAQTSPQAPPPAAPPAPVTTKTETTKTTTSGSPQSTQDANKNITSPSTGAGKAGSNSSDVNVGNGTESKNISTPGTDSNKNGINGKNRQNIPHLLRQAPLKTENAQKKVYADYLQVMPVKRIDTRRDGTVFDSVLSKKADVARTDLADQNYDLQQLKLHTQLPKTIAASKKSLLTISNADKKQGVPKLGVAPMVLVNPSPELHVDLTEDEVYKIKHRAGNQEPQQHPNLGNSGPIEGEAVPTQSAQKGTIKDKATLTNVSNNSKVSEEKQESMQQKTKASSTPVTSSDSSNKPNNVHDKTSDKESAHNDEEPGYVEVQPDTGQQHYATITEDNSALRPTVSIDETDARMVEDEKNSKNALKAEQQKDIALVHGNNSQADQSSPSVDANRMKNDRQTHKSTENTQIEHNDVQKDPLGNTTSSKHSANQESKTVEKDNLKAGESNLNGVGALSQGYEVHSGNNAKLHVDSHPSKQVQHPNLFHGKFSPSSHVFSTIGGSSRTNVENSSSSKVLNHDNQITRTSGNSSQDHIELKKLFDVIHKPSVINNNRSESSTLSSLAIQNGTVSTSCKGGQNVSLSCVGNAQAKSSAMHVSRVAYSSPPESHTKDNQNETLKLPSHPAQHFINSQINRSFEAPKTDDSPHEISQSFFADEKPDISKGTIHQHHLDLKSNSQMKSSLASPRVITVPAKKLNFGGGEDDIIDSHLVGAVEDVSSNAIQLAEAELREHSKKSDGTKEVPIPTVQNLNWDQEETLTKQALEARKREIDRLLELLDQSHAAREEAKTAANRAGIQQVLSPSENSELKTAFDKLKAERPHSGFVKTMAKHMGTESTIRGSDNSMQTALQNATAAYMAHNSNFHNKYFVPFEHIGPSQSSFPMTGSLNVEGKIVPFISEEMQEKGASIINGVSVGGTTLKEQVGNSLQNHNSAVNHNAALLSQKQSNVKAHLNTFAHRLVNGQNTNNLLHSSNFVGSQKVAPALPIRLPQQNDIRLVPKAPMLAPFEDALDSSLKPKDNKHRIGEGKSDPPQAPIEAKADEPPAEAKPEELVSEQKPDEPPTEPKPDEPPTEPKPDEPPTEPKPDEPPTEAKPDEPPAEPTEPPLVGTKPVTTPPPEAAESPKPTTEPPTPPETTAPPPPPTTTLPPTEPPTTFPPSPPTTPEIPTTIPLETTIHPLTTEKPHHPEDPHRMPHILGHQLERPVQTLHHPIVHVPDPHVMHPVPHPNIPPHALHNVHPSGDYIKPQFNPATDSYNGNGNYMAGPGHGCGCGGPLISGEGHTSFGNGPGVMRPCGPCGPCGHEENRQDAGCSHVPPMNSYEWGEKRHGDISTSARLTGMANYNSISEQLHQENAMNQNQINSRKALKPPKMPTMPSIPNGNILDARFDKPFQARPAMFRPAHPTLAPTSPPGFPTLFRHVRKGGVVQNNKVKLATELQSGKPVNNPPTKKSVPSVAPANVMANQQDQKQKSNFQKQQQQQKSPTDHSAKDALQWARKQIEEANINGKVPHARHKPVLAWTETSFAPHKGEPILLPDTNSKGLKRSSEKMKNIKISHNSTVSERKHSRKRAVPSEKGSKRQHKPVNYGKFANTLRKILLASATPTKPSKPKSKGKKKKLAKAFVAPFIALPEYKNSRLVDNKLSSLGDVGALYMTDDDDESQPLLSLDDKPTRQPTKHKQKSHYKKNVQTALQKVKTAKNESSISSHVNVNETAVKNATKISDHETSAATKKPASINLKEALQMFETGNPDQKGQVKHNIGLDSIKYKESDFPMTFQVNDFKLSDLPALPVGKSFVISQATLGSVSVSIRDEIDRESPLLRGTPSMKKSHYFRTVQEDSPESYFNWSNQFVRRITESDDAPSFSNGGKYRAEYEPGIEDAIPSSYRGYSDRRMVHRRQPRLRGRVKEIPVFRYRGGGKEVVMSNELPTSVPNMFVGRPQERHYEFNHEYNRYGKEHPALNVIDADSDDVFSKESVWNQAHEHLQQRHVRPTEPHNAINQGLGLRRLHVISEGNHPMKTIDGEHEYTYRIPRGRQLHMRIPYAKETDQDLVKPTMNAHRDEMNQGDNSDISTGEQEMGATGMSQPVESKDGSTLTNSNESHEKQSENVTSAAKANPTKNTSNEDDTNLMELIHSVVKQSPHESKSFMATRQHNHAKMHHHQHARSNQTSSATLAEGIRNTSTTSIHVKAESLNETSNATENMNNEKASSSAETHENSDNSVKSLYDQILHNDGLTSNSTSAAEPVNENNLTTTSLPTYSVNKTESAMPQNETNTMYLTNASDTSSNLMAGNNSASSEAEEIHPTRRQGSNVGNWSTKPNPFIEQMTNMEYILGCNKPLRVLFAIDVSDALGDGTQRNRRWNRLKQFMQGISRDVIQGVKTKYMVYNIEPRFLDNLEPCDKNTEYFMAGDECLCTPESVLAGSEVCSTNAPSRSEGVEDWGRPGPRTGYALEAARKNFFSSDLAKFKNLVFLISHKTPADNVTEAENDLKKDGISLVDIELGDRHDLRRRSEISHVMLRYRRFSDTDEVIPKEHKMKVSLRKLQLTLRGIVSKVCRSKSYDSGRRSRIHKYHKRRGFST